uniref:Oxidoreductase-like domain-containing protein n=1 Tax=Neospora caninum (strain Liverpool) TaxID=572307 RepID=A0A0F7UBT4_NEOCL|nr:TPA: hypothetical protein BN1204_031140 [Neospora caninum Liverpool]
MYLSPAKPNLVLCLGAFCRNVSLALISGLRPRTGGAMERTTEKAPTVDVPGQASCMSSSSSLPSHTAHPSVTHGEESATRARPTEKNETSESASASPMNRQPGSDPLLEKPVPPWKPEPEDCCGSGCERCIFDVYYEQLEKYEEALSRWELRQRELGQTGDGKTPQK